MERASAAYENDLNLKSTELRLGLPGTDESSEKQSSRNYKRSSPEMDNSCQKDEQKCVPASKAQVVGWPPVRSYLKNVLHQKNDSDLYGMFVKVSMDGAPYLRKIDIKVYKNYPDLLKALENMFKCSIGVYSEREGCNGSEFAPTYEDKDGDWMLVGDVHVHYFLQKAKNNERIRS
ncbi:auxin-induced protein 22D-like [Olea europaea var. sylvestris]|uniref:Auxin-responsive protein n=1 Tax=Olea europaea subsp. europaea TaxID=158383 RepID=A0A8S0R8R4_OLEEU|nr:auxin-induced protein 22D-like [Olea europaea var. sylvestris]CAA2975712.1 auxin-induced 22D-like [Olea europaea subsp. europaea]